jgi:hypothetical protein
MSQPIKERLQYKGYPINKETINGVEKFDYIGTPYPTLQALKNFLDNRYVTFYRNPTEYEIKFGEGAIHFKEFKVGNLKLRKDGLLPTRLKDKTDGLIYTRK